MSLEVVIGPMFSGKSSYIYSIVKRYGCLEIPTLVVKPSIDDRYSVLPECVTHDGIKFSCVSAKSLMDIAETVSDKEVIIVEEAQFFSDLLEFVVDAVDGKNKKVIVVGLDGDSNRKKFGQILDCIPLADKITKLNALCVECRDGTVGLFSYRVCNDKSQVHVGGAEDYKPLCRACYINAVKYSTFS